MGKVVVRRSGARTVVAMLVVLSSVAACGDGSGKSAGKGTAVAEASKTSASVTQAVDKPLSKADLERAAITAKDLEDYKADRTGTMPVYSANRADPAYCGPIAKALADSSAYPTTARIGWSVFPKDHGPGVSMSLASYGAGTAKRVISALRTAAERCNAFWDFTASFRYTAVEVQPDPGYGDESVFLRLIQLVPAYDDEDETIKVAFAMVAVRQGTTVAMFHEFKNPNVPGEKGPASVPDAVVRAQLDKLAKLGAVE